MKDANGQIIRKGDVLIQVHSRSGYLYPEQVSEFSCHAWKYIDQVENSTMGYVNLSPIKMIKTYHSIAADSFIVPKSEKEFIWAFNHGMGKIYPLCVTTVRGSSYKDVLDNSDWRKLLYEKY